MTLLAAQLHELQAARDEAAMLAASSKPIEAKAKATRAGETRSCWPTSGCRVARSHRVLLAFSEAEEAEKEVAKLRVQLERVKSQSKKDLLQAAAHVEEMTMVMEVTPEKMCAVGNERPRVYQAYERLENELAKATTEVEKVRAGCVQCAATVLVPTLDRPPSPS